MHCPALHLTKKQVDNRRLRQKPRYHITPYWLRMASCSHFEHWGNEERLWKNICRKVIQLEIWSSFIHSQLGQSAVWHILAQKQLAAEQITSLRKSAAGSSSRIYRSIDYPRISELSDLIVRRLQSALQRAWRIGLQDHRLCGPNPMPQLQAPLWP